MITIYQLINIITGQYYIGQTRQTLEKRFASGHGYKTCPYLHHAIQKYGAENFEYHILMIIESDDQELANYWEDYYIDMFDSRNRELGYNIKEGGANGPHSEETKQKMSKNSPRRKQPEHVKEKLRLINSGIKRSEETKRKVSENHADVSGENNPNYGKHWSEEWKQEQSQKMTGKYIGEKNPFFGKTHTKENKIKMGNVNRGKPSTFLGRKHTEESKKLMSSVKRKFTPEQIRYIRSELATGKKMEELAKEMGCGAKFISKIKNRRAYSDVE